MYSTGLLLCEDGLAHGLLEDEERRVHFLGGAEGGAAGVIGPAAQVHRRDRPAGPFAGGAREIKLLYGRRDEAGGDRGFA